MDRLDQDRQPSGYLSRSRREKQLERIGKYWNTKALIQQLRQLDTDSYRHQTFDFRNRASHAIPTNFEAGHTNFVVRARTPKSELVTRSDGLFELREHITDEVVAYHLGGTPPLEFQRMYSINLCEYSGAIAVLRSYEDLLKEIFAST